MNAQTADYIVSKNRKGNFIPKNRLMHILFLPKLKKKFPPLAIIISFMERNSGIIQRMEMPFVYETFVHDRLSH